jgi:hypothetical protein
MDPLNRPKLSLADLDDRLEKFFLDRVVAKSYKTERHRDIEAMLHKLDAGLVKWFAERGIELVVDRDTVTHARLPQDQVVMSKS